jgi:hypothetical protein
VLLEASELTITAVVDVARLLDGDIVTRTVSAPIPKKRARDIIFDFMAKLLTIVKFP